MALEHQLRVTGSGVPELHATILRPRHDPMGIRSKGDTEDEVL